MMYPPFKELLVHGRAMFMELEKNAEYYGLLGYSNFYSTDSTTKSISMSVMYFETLDGLHRYAHGSQTHRAGWEWYNEVGAGAKEVSIGHEIYDVPEGKWETIYGNSKPNGFGKSWPLELRKLLTVADTLAQLQRHMQSKHMA
jgi:Domain of unknown function (DUF4188)